VSDAATGRLLRGLGIRGGGERACELCNAEHGGLTNGKRWRRFFLLPAGIVRECALLRRQSCHARPVHRATHRPLHQPACACCVRPCCAHSCALLQMSGTARGASGAQQTPDSPKPPETPGHAPTPAPVQRNTLSQPATLQAHAPASVGVWINKLNQPASLSFDQSNGYWIAGTYQGLHVIEAGQLKTPSLIGMECLCCHVPRVSTCLFLQP
jgi:hypothetical protein